jgi:hypothetical protein
MSDENPNLPDENTKRFVAVLNEKIEIGRLLNALGHMTAGLSAHFKDSEELCFLQYQDADGGAHPNISHFPFIVLKAENSNQIRKVRAEVLSRQIPFTDFASTMTVGSSAEQVASTKAKPEAELEYFGICMFGDTAVIKEFTKRFSLFR